GDPAGPSQPFLRWTVRCRPPGTRPRPSQRPRLRVHQSSTDDGQVAGLDTRRLHHRPQAPRARHLCADLRGGRDAHARRARRPRAVDVARRDRATDWADVSTLGATSTHSRRVTDWADVRDSIRQVFTGEGLPDAYCGWRWRAK